MGFGLGGLGSTFSGIGGAGLLGAGLGFAVGGPTGAMIGYGLGSGIDGYNNNRYNMDMQNQYNLQYWNMQNAYNHPAAQMQRYREAGLNPNLIYSQQNLAGSVGSVNSNLHSPDLLGMLGQYYQIRNLGAQNENLLAQNDNLHSQNLLTLEQTEALRIQNKLRLDAGPLADAPWYMRMIYRALPSSWKLPNGDLNFGRLSDADISRILVSGLTGAMSLPNGFLNPVYGTQSYPPVGNLTYGDRGR